MMEFAPVFLIRSILGKLYGFVAAILCFFVIPIVAIVG